MFASYLKIAWKVLQRRRFFTAVSVFGIALTLSVLTLVAAVFDHTLGPRAPEVHMARTVGLYAAEMSGETMTRNGFAGYGLLDRYARDLPGVERLAIVSVPIRVASYVNGAKVRSYARRTDAEYWQVLAFEFLEGGPFTGEDVAAGRHLAVINATTRGRFFGGAPAVGRTFEADGQTFTVVGVVPDVPMLRLVAFGDIYVPVTTTRGDSYRTDLVGDFLGLLLLRPGADRAALRAEFASRMQRVEFPDPRQFTRIRAVPETHVEAVERLLLGERGEGDRGARLGALLVAGTLLFMLLPAINLVNLNVSRILERASEIGVRKAFGASSRTLIAQFLVENLVLTLVGGVVGAVVAWLTLQAVNASGLIPYADLAMNPRVLGWGLLMAILFALVSGGYPAWRMSRMQPVNALRGALS